VYNQALLQGLQPLLLLQEVQHQAKAEQLELKEAADKGKNA